jgi:CheY-like chemotaxis protein
VVAENGHAALDALERARFDIVLMDLQMPVMDGIEATAAIRERERATGGHVRVIAMTAHAMRGDRDRCLAAGMDGYLSKPIDPHILFAAVEQREPTAEPSAALRVTASPVRSSMFDEAALRARVHGDEELMHEVVRLFLEDCPARVAAIEDAARRRDAAALRAAAHALKGAAGNLGAPGLFEAARVIERIGDECRMDAAESACRRLAAEAATLLDLLRSFGLAA